MSKCYAKTCGTPAKKGQLMCLRHWKLVPKEIQTLVNRTWRAYSSGDGSSENYLNAINAARDAAET